MTLGLIVPYGEHETATSFASRLAMWNGCPDVRRFCGDFSMAFRDVVEGHEETLRRLAEMGGADPGLLGRHSFRSRGEYLDIGGEVVVRSSVKWTHVRACPRCLAADAARWPLEGAGPYQRAEWAIRWIRTCPVHNVALMRIARGDRFEALDFSNAIAGIDVEALAGQAAQRRPSRLEAYLQDRLAGKGGKRESWLDDFPLHVVGRLCEAVGAVLAEGCLTDPLIASDNFLHRAGDAGFNLLESGENGLFQFLEQAIEPFWKGRNEARATALFKHLHRLLTDGDEPSYGRLRTMVREWLLDRLPADPGMMVLGEKLETRRLWSIHAARKATGVHRKRLRSLLHSMDIITESQRNSSDDRIVFKADKKSERALHITQNSMGIETARLYISTSKKNMKSIVDGGLIKPYKKIENGSNSEYLFLKEDLENFMKSIIDQCQNDLADGKQRYDVAKTSVVARSSELELFSMNINKQLTESSMGNGRNGLSDIMFDIEEVSLVVNNKRKKPSLSSLDICKETGFGYGIVRKLIKDGHLPVFKERNGLTNVERLVTSREDFEEFIKKYVSHRELMKKLGASSRELNSISRSKNISAAFRIGRYRFYLRCDIANF
ncbi:TniQ family protein [Nitrospirillum sp. BR 11164]|uniref:TniQ family protein n=1 Tax=Nitrospirillum sp. BR 11164 TaxID=3104324 RepID=UPI002AFF5C27|nr:TniQ family protein [Nitrospirillum sp. BR 11164]MEA1647814.1 TniQ family protein [Nitrospirillum sp. BR 11164]